MFLRVTGFNLPFLGFMYCFLFILFPRLIAVKISSGSDSFVWVAGIRDPVFGSTGLICVRFSVVFYRSRFLFASLRCDGISTEVPYCVASVLGYRLLERRLSTGLVVKGIARFDYKKALGLSFFIQFASVLHFKHFELQQCSLT